MDKIKIFLLEDNKQDYGNFVDASNVLKAKNKFEVELHRFENCAESLLSLDNSFDGAIIDLKIGNDTAGGNEIAKKILETTKIPTFIFTATPDASQMDTKKIPIYKKGSVDPAIILENFYGIYKTGLTKIFGDRGHINKLMTDLFWENLIPNIDEWTKHECNDSAKEKSLLRVTLNNILTLLEDDLEMVLGEEMYIRSVKRVRTGSIVQYSGQNYVVLTPACDLEPRANFGGKPKANRVLLCEIVPTKDLYEATVGKKTEEKTIKDSLKEVLKNKQNYNHWLPHCGSFEGGMMDFRHIKTVAWDEFDNSKTLILQIAESFTKDIISRFSSFYSRQGQPDFSFDYLVDKIHEKYKPRPTTPPK